MKKLKLFFIWVICVLAMIISSICMFFAIFTNEDKATHLAIATDRQANTAFNGNYNETISSRANRSRLENKSWGCFLCKILDKIQKDHCKNSAGV